MDERKDELIRILRDKSYEKKRVILKSGRESDFYVDGRQTTLHARGALLIGELIADRLLADDRPVVGVGGMTLGADPIATAVSVVTAIRERPIHAFLVRKQAKGHGMGRQVEGLANLPRGSRVCMVEDTTTTGGSTLAAIDAAREAGLDVVRVITLVDRQEGAAENLTTHGHTLEALVTREELVDD
jgi:orotate phosphoribosyltransferase